MCRSAQDAIDADPGWAGAYETLASIYATQGQHQILLRDNEAAYESYRRILLLDLEGEVLTGSVLAGAYYGMGRALHAEGIGAEANMTFPPRSLLADVQSLADSDDNDGLYRKFGEAQP